MANRVRSYRLARAHDQAYVQADAGYIPLRRRDGSTAAWAIVDIVDFEDVARFNWSQTAKGYAQRRSAETGIVQMHRHILGLSSGDGLHGDHKDRNILNHRRENLRIVPNNAANRQNLNPRGGTSSVYRGVGWAKREGKWRARAKIAGRECWVGLFDDEHEAGRAAAAFRLKHMPYAVD